MNHAPLLDNVRIVLVRPIRSGNVGAICRAMVNMGLSDLALVAPQCDIHDAAALGFAARAGWLLERASISPDIPAALADAAQTWAATGKGGIYRRQAAETARVAAVQAIATARDARVALALGPEDQGLALDEILLFDRVIEIPAAPDYPVMNLAAAATVLCYELHQAARAAAPPPADPGQDEPLATANRKDALAEQLFRALDRIGFFRAQQRDNHLQFALRRVLGKAGLTVKECDVLLGMAKQINWYADRHGEHDAARDRREGRDADR